MKMYNFGKAAAETVGASSVIGKGVVDARGEELGTVKELHLDPENLTVEGIRLDKGLFQGKDYVGKEYIANMAGEKLLLSVTPLSEYLGMEVLDKKGERVGVVRDINRARKTNNLYSITVERKQRPDLIVMEDFIENVGERIMLNRPIEA